MLFRPTVRSTFISDDPNLVITYFRPSTTAFNSDKILESKKDIMYFYYGVEVSYKGKLLLEVSTHDFPKVDTLPEVIEYLLSDDDYVLENAKGGTYYTYYIKYKKAYNHSHWANHEYSYYFEAIKTQCLKEDKHVSEYEYILNISNHQVINRYKNDKVSTPVRIVLNKDEMLRLKNVAEDFMNKAVNDYNKFEFPEVLKYLDNED